jgi:hypothetical protein
MEDKGECHLINRVGEMVVMFGVWTDLKYLLVVNEEIFCH